ncbi:MAG: Gfo/Idh/MocA family oxidoreductase [Cyanobacteria bacterium J06573_11]
MGVRVGLIGTGYAAKVRAESFLENAQSDVVRVAGRDFARAEAFAMGYDLTVADSWRALVRAADVDVVVISTVSGLHGEMAEAALNAGKHVVVEYPLSLDVVQADRLVMMAEEKGLMLHVEHIELLGGLHLAMRSHLPSIGTPLYINYRTLNPQHPAPKKWTYHQALSGFPFCNALSRVNRLTNLFGEVSAVDCCLRMRLDEQDDNYFRSILSSGRLQFANGAVAELTYGKGEDLWAYRREVEIQGSMGAIAFNRNEGILTTAKGEQKIAVAPRKGLFAQDTQNVLAHLIEGEPLYVTASESLYALKVGDAMRRASESGQTVRLA